MTMESRCPADSVGTTEKQYSALWHFSSMSNNSNNNDNNNNNICPLWDTLKYCFISNHFASLGRVIWDPSTPHGNKEVSFVLMQVLGFTICSLLKCQELKSIRIKGFSSLQRATQASATYSPSDSSSFCSPFYTLFHCSKWRSNTTFPEPAVSPISRGTGTAITTPTLCCLLHKSRKITLLDSKPFHSPASQ